jgi:hypothetical protein
MRHKGWELNDTWTEWTLAYRWYESEPNWHRLCPCNVHCSIWRREKEECEWVRVTHIARSTAPFFVVYVSPLVDEKRWVRFMDLLWDSFPDAEIKKEYLNRIPGMFGGLRRIGFMDEKGDNRDSLLIIWRRWKQSGRGLS